MTCEASPPGLGMPTGGRCTRPLPMWMASSPQKPTPAAEARLSNLYWQGQPSAAIGSGQNGHRGSRGLTTKIPLPRSEACVEESSLSRDTWQSGQPRDDDPSRASSSRHGRRPWSTSTSTITFTWPGRRLALRRPKTRRPAAGSYRRQPAGPGHLPGHVSRSPVAQVVVPGTDACKGLGRVHEFLNRLDNCRPGRRGGIGD
jgi:hypothetical protein